MRLRYLFIGLFAYFLFLPFTLPATHLFGWLAQAAPEISLASVSGTAWAGHAVKVQYQGLELEKLRWKFRPLMLLLGKLEFRVKFVTGNGQGGGLGVGRSPFGTLYLKDGHARLPAIELSPLLPDEAISLGGYFQLELEHGIFEQGPAELKGSLVWINAAIEQPIALSLGDLQLMLEPVEAGIQGTLKDLKGPMGVQGKLTLDNDGTYRIVGTLEPRESLPNQVRQALSIFGQADGSGRYKVDFSGTL